MDIAPVRTAFSAADRRKSKLLSGLAAIIASNGGDVVANAEDYSEEASGELLRCCVPGPEAVRAQTGFRLEDRFARP